MRKYLYLLSGLIALGLVVGIIAGKKKPTPPNVVISDPVAPVMDKLTALGANILDSGVKQGVLTATLSSGLTIVLNIENLPSNWDTTLQFILNRSKISGKLPKIIDLRFKSPVVTYGQE